MRIVRTTRAAVSAFFTAIFSTPENPISQSGNWLNGAADALDYNNVQITADGACGTNFATGFDDSIAFLKAAVFSFIGAQYVQATVFRKVGYTITGGFHEIELFLKCAMSAHNARGYECSIGMSGSGYYAFIVRWNGTSFDTLVDPTNGPLGSYINAPQPIADGDVNRAEITAGGVITLYQNGVPIVSATDTTWTDGQVGIGWWPTNGTGVDPVKMGYKSMIAGNL